MNREPVALPGLITAAVIATLGVAIAFGVNITKDQIGAITIALGAWQAVMTFFQRSQVTPLADPRDAQGERLKPASAVLTDEAARALEAQLLVETDNGAQPGDPADADS